MKPAWLCGSYFGGALRGFLSAKRRHGCDFEFHVKYFASRALKEEASCGLEDEWAYGRKAIVESWGLLLSTRKRFASRGC